MKIETLKQKGKKIAIGILISITLFSVLVLSLSLAKYRSTNSINIAKGTIKYNRPDLHLAEVYIESDTAEYEIASEVPESGYVLNEDTTKTRCENKDKSIANITITYENESLTFSKLVTGGVKCYVYLDKVPPVSNKIPDGITTPSNIFNGTSGNGIYIWDKGDYSNGDQLIKYYRGNVDNNWVVFGKDDEQYIWWRIIRNNSNGSLRMIYAGLSSNKTTAPATRGAGTSIGTKVYNTIRDDNMYVGFKYTSGDAHGTGTNSAILGETNGTDKTTLYGWYNATLGKSLTYSKRIDINAGFCNDRTPYSGTGIGTTTTYYGAHNRLNTNKSPSLLCPNKRDIFNTPIGLITADEVAMGGMHHNLTNSSSYLYTGEHYWTMTPAWSDNKNPAHVFRVYSTGQLNPPTVTEASVAVRPVINLKSDTLFEEGGEGTSTHPYVVHGT